MREEERVAQTYSFEWDHREHFRACRTIYARAIRRRWATGLIRLAYVLSATLVVVNMIADFERERFPAVLPALVLLVAAPFVPMLNAYLNARQWAKLNPPGHRVVTITVAGDHFRSASHAGAIETRWTAVRQIVETSEFLLIYVTDRLAHYVPKRAISSRDMADVGRLVSSRMDSRHVHLLPETVSATSL